MVITDDNGCQDSASITITEPALLVASALVDSNASCMGLADGGATASGIGGTIIGSYAFLWDDPSAQTNASATGLAAGTYNVTITDDNGCQDTESITITEPITLTASIALDSNASCNGIANGGATASATGGTVTGAYQFLWDDPSAQTNASATGLAAGTYTVTITDDIWCHDT